MFLYLKPDIKLKIDKPQYYNLTLFWVNIIIFKI